jgi:hypothetical protein
MGIKDATAVSGEKSQLELPKAGNRVAVLTGIIDVGIHQSEYKGEKKKPCREFIPVYTLAKDTYETDDGEIKHMVLRPWPLKLMPGADKAKYKGWYNAHDPEHKLLDVNGGGDITKLIGTVVSVKVVHSEPNTEGLVYANMDIAGIAALPDDYPVPEVDYEPLIFDTSDPCRDTFDSLGTYTQDTVRKSIGYAGSELEAILEGQGKTATKTPDAPNEDEGDAPV